MVNPLNLFITCVYAVTLFASPLCSQESIQFGAKLNGKFSGGEEVKDLFVPFHPGSTYSYWELSESFVRIDVFGVLGRSTITKTTSIEFKGQIYFLTQNKQKHLLREFSETINISYSPRGKAVLKHPWVFIPIANKGDLRNVKTDSPFTTLVVELVKPISLKVSFPQPQPFGFGE